MICCVNVTNKSGFIGFKNKFWNRFIFFKSVYASKNPATYSNILYYFILISINKKFWLLSLTSPMKLSGTKNQLFTVHEPSSPMYFLVNKSSPLEKERPLNYTRGRPEAWPFFLRFFFPSPLPFSLVSCGVKSARENEIRYLGTFLVFTVH